MAVDLPPNLPEAVACSVAAAEEYGFPPEVMLAVAQAEGGSPGLKVRNKNGTYDVGSMQFNTGYLKTLEKYGIRESDVAVSGCFPFRLAAWRIAKHLKEDTGSVWTRTANYHSRTPKFNAAYQKRLKTYAARWRVWLKAPTAVSLPWRGTSVKGVRAAERKPILSFEDYLKSKGFQ